MLQQFRPQPEFLHRSRSSHTLLRRPQRGFSLVVVLMVLVVVGVVGVAAARLGNHSEHISRNERDAQLARMGAQAAINDAIDDITRGTRTAVVANSNSFQPCGPGQSAPVAAQRGLCNDEEDGQQWLKVDMLAPDNPHTVAFGTFTGKPFAAGAVGIRPAHKPRYLIELLPGPDARCASSSVADTSVACLGFDYLITAVGYGPGEATTSVLQVTYTPPQLP